MMKNKIISGFLAVLMIFSMSYSCFTVSADNAVISIKTAEDFIDFSNHCVIDEYSRGLTAELCASIDFTGKDFVPVPIFCGTFKGNGYTISGISYNEKGSYKGIFRHIEKGASVSDLNVLVSFDLNGSKSFLGGIAGENSGTIENCSFDGSLKGENVIGGIVGNNTDDGKIISCSSNGTVTGENSTGGICGKNSGFIQNCHNYAAVNTVYEEKKTEITDIETDAAAIVENIKNSEEESREETVLGHTDTGGIVGFTSGIIQGCSNNGNVGYKHIGYNVGGIAGRQSGYILGCDNYGFIQGRKDIGGIAGQAEPYILLHSSDSMLDELKTELNNLSSMVNKFISDTDNLGNETKTHLDGISKYAEDARNSTQDLIDETADFADDNIAEINAEAAIISNTIDKLEPVFESLEKGGSDLGNAIDDLNTTISDLNLYAPDFADEIDGISSALTYISKSESSISRASIKAERAIDALDNAVIIKNTASIKNALSELSNAIDEIITARSEIENSLSEIEKILGSNSDDLENSGLNIEELSGIFKDILSNSSTIVTSLKTIKNSIDTIALNTEINFEEFKTAAKNMNSSIDYIFDAMQYITKGIGKLSKSLSDFSDKFEEYASDMSDELSVGKENLTKSLDSLSYATEDITDALGDIKTIISDLADEEPAEFVKLGDDFRTASDNLFNSISEISDELNSLKNTLSDKTDKINEDLTAINNKFNVVMNLIVGEVEELKNGAQTLSDVFVDVSEEDINSVRQGKIQSCNNSGSVEADRNTGGIVGNIAIEYSKDPEDELEKPTTLNFTYRTRAILQSCTNDAKITGKKDCTGGILGKGEIGTVYECENYGDVESTNGNYVGGIVGKSTSSVKKCYAKSKVTGKRYIGGIVGMASTLTSSYAIASVSGEENIGACCGEADISKIYNNFYVNNGLGAVDGVSYKGHCEEISYDALKNISYIAPRFISFSVIFVANGKTIETQDIRYGSETNRIKYPDVPEKNGHFGKWNKPEAETVTENITIECEYQPYITILASDKKNENGKLSVGLAEGKFTDEARLHIEDSSEAPPVRTANNVSTLDISLTNTDITENDAVTIRLLNENKDKVSAWRLNSNSQWEKLKVSKKGKYVVAELIGTENTVCLQYDKQGSALLWIMLLLIFVCGASVIFTRKKRLKK